MLRIVCDPPSGIIELYLTEILSGSLMFFVCLIGVWQRNFELVVCVCVQYDCLRPKIKAEYFLVLTERNLIFHFPLHKHAHNLKF